MIAADPAAIIAWTFCLTVYATPSILALHRKIDHKWPVVVINLLLGWTLLGWVVALAMAVWPKHERHPASV